MKLNSTSIITKNCLDNNVAVVGVHEDNGLGELVVACVVRKDQNLTAEDVIRFCLYKLTDYKVPAHVWFRDELPMNANGKILKRELSRQARELLDHKRHLGGF
ncbi:MAG: hypothetical protein HQK60_02530 [Deltaproteobacteria bacterium]|nr:hypothetical protein [Deltaproteobacteria bacterium]